MEDHLGHVNLLVVAVVVVLAGVVAVVVVAASFSSLSVNHFSRQRSQRCKTADCRQSGKISKSAFCLVFTCHSNCSMLGLSFIVVIPHVDILHYPE